MASGTRTQVFKLGSKHLYSLSHLASLSHLNFESGSVTELNPGSQFQLDRLASNLQSSCLGPQSSGITGKCPVLGPTGSFHGCYSSSLLKCSPTVPALAEYPQQMISQLPAFLNHLLFTERKVKTLPKLQFLSKSSFICWAEPCRQGQPPHPTPPKNPNVHTTQNHSGTTRPGK